MSGVITLLKNFTFVGDSGQSWATDWIGVPAEYQNWQLIVIVKSIITGSSLAYILQTTWDTDSATSTSGTGTMTVVTTLPSAISSGVGPMVRLLLTAGGPSPSQVVFSAYLTPKST